MALRWRNHGRGRLLCARTHEAKKNDCYISDALHQKLAVDLRVVLPDDDEEQTGVWRWTEASERED